MQIKNLNTSNNGKRQKKGFSSTLIAENPINTAFSNPTSAEILVNPWCGRGDLNPHRLTPTTPSK